MKNEVTQRRDEFFTKKFREIYDEKWKKNGRSQAEFARAVNEFQEDEGRCTYQLVSKWYNGTFPEKYFSSIAKVLGVEEDEFFPQTHDEKYRSSSVFMTGVGEGMREYSEKIGLNESFLHILRSMGDFETDFPFYCPIVEKTDKTTFRSEFVRLNETNASDSAPMLGDDLPVFQFERDGKLITMSVEDLEFLKDVQDKVEEYVSFLYYQRRKEAQREVQILNEDAIHTEELPGGVTVTAFSGLSSLERNKYDKYFARAWERKHTEEENDNGTDS